MTQTLLIRTDGNSQIGTGHVMRCLTLAQAWHQIGGTVRFVGSDIPNGLRDRIDEWSQGIDFLNLARGSQEDAAQTAAIAGEYDAEWIIVDGPHFDTDYLTELTSGDSRVLLIDDIGERSHYDTDLVLNQNLHADPEMYVNRDPDGTTAWSGLRAVQERVPKMERLVAGPHTDAGDVAHHARRERS